MDLAGFYNKCPKLNTAVAKVSKRSNLSFEDVGLLKDLLDRKMDSVLRRAWKSSATSFNLSPGIWFLDVSSCRSTYRRLWVGQGPRS